MTDSKIGRLIVSRRGGVGIQESVLIGDDITVTVLAAKGGKAKLLITAPKTLPVDREELRIRKQESQAAGETNA